MGQAIQLWGLFCKTWILTLEVPRPISYQKALKIVIFVVFAQEINKKYVLESDHRILYLTYLRLYGKNFMKFDRKDLKIWAFKVWKNSSFKL